MIDRGRESENAQKRQKPEQDHRPSGDCGQDHHADQKDIRNPDLFQKPRDQQGRENEDQRSRPMGKHIPKFAQIGPGLGLQTPRSAQVQRQAGCDHGDHARGADTLLRPDVGKIGERNRDRDLRQFVLAE